MTSIHAVLIQNGVVNNEVQHGTLEIDETIYEYAYDFDSCKLVIDGGKLKGKEYRMTYLVLEERAPLEARILARGILHHFKRKA